MVRPPLSHWYARRVCSLASFFVVSALFVVVAAAEEPDNLIIEVNKKLAPGFKRFMVNEVSLACFSLARLYLFHSGAHLLLLLLTLNASAPRGRHRGQSERCRHSSDVQSG